jgi:MoaA/NifB/PqqE/SkfB family radical SAM enzyme
MSILALPRIRSIFIHVTKACNLRCSYCYFSAQKPLTDEMTTEEFSRLWPDIAMVKPDKVVFTGGEPFLRQDIIDLLRGLDQADSLHTVRRCINTNGHLLTYHLVQRLIGLVDEVRVSLDAMRERNDAQRAWGNFDAAIRALEILHSAGFEPKVLVTVTSASLPDLEQLICFLLSKNIKRIKLNPFRPIGRGAERPQWTVGSTELDATFRQVWKRCFPEQSLPGQSVCSDSQSTCGVGQFLNIMPNGDVFPCHVLTDPEFRCGTLRKQSLKEICSPASVCGKLAQLDFKELAMQAPALAELSRRGTCLGAVYGCTKSLAVWRQALPLVQKEKTARET